MKTVFEWSNGCMAHGTEDTEDAALEALQPHVSFDLVRAIPVNSPDGATSYYYATWEEADADEDGAYAVQITEKDKDE